MAGNSRIVSLDTITRISFLAFLCDSPQNVYKLSVRVSFGADFVVDVIVVVVCVCACVLACVRACVRACVCVCVFNNCCSVIDVSCNQR